MVDDFYPPKKHNEKDSKLSDDSYEQEKTVNTAHGRTPSTDRPHYQPVIYERPKGLKGFYQHPTTQVCLLGLTCFMCPGLYNALNGLGLGGQLTSEISANANAAVYATFAFASFFAGSVNNKLGSKRTLILGSLAYPLYIGSYLALNIHSKAGAFVIATGAILGVCAGLLWSAQGSLMLAYPIESQKGLYIGIFWSIFNLGGVVGAAVSFAENSKSKSDQVDNGTYIVFLVLTFTGVLIPLIMTDPNKMIRTDGTRVTTPRHPSWKVEFYFLWVALRTDPYILLLFPLFFTSNWFYTWQFNDYNGVLFNIRTRSLNNFCYWLSQIVGSLAIGLLLDRKRLTRRTRAFLGWIVLFTMVFAVHTWAYFYQRKYTRASVAFGRKIDFQDPDYPPKLCLYILCGMLDAMWQTAAYWMMGAMSNDPAKLAYFTGFYKSLQSAGAAGIWRADAVGLPFMSIFASTWALLVAGLIFALPMLYLRVHDTTAYEDEVLARMDENGQVQSISDYHTRSISDADFVFGERGMEQHGYPARDDVTGQFNHRQMQHRHPSEKSQHRPEPNHEQYRQYDERANYRYGHGYHDEKGGEVDHHEDYLGKELDDSGGNGDGGIKFTMERENQIQRSRSEPAQGQRTGSMNLRRSPPTYPGQLYVEEQQEEQNQVQTQIQGQTTPLRLQQPQPALQRLHRDDDGSDSSHRSLKGSSSYWHVNNSNSSGNRHPAPDDYRVQRSKQDWNQSSIENWREKYREGEAAKQSR